MLLTAKMKQHLKAKAHKLKPFVLIGSQGLTEAVIKEIQRALGDHELIKIRLATMDRKERLNMAANISDSTQAELVQMIGHIATFYRKNSENQ